LLEQKPNSRGAGKAAGVLCTLAFEPSEVEGGRQLFNRFSGRSRGSLGPQEISDFLESVRVSESAEIWQASQARDALILYYE
jgi:hypothetical protein